jgi:uncharacterized membrane protein
MNRIHRYWKHFTTDKRDAQRLFSSDALKAITHAVTQAEAGTSGEIDVCIEPALPFSYLHKNLHSKDRALMLFGKLRVWDTEHNNGVLIYVNVAEHALELVCDRALARVVPQTRWAEITRLACDELRANRYAQGIEWAVLECGRELKAHFTAAERQDKNQHPDAPVMLG